MDDYKKYNMLESTDNILSNVLQKISSGEIFDNENEKYVKKLLFEERHRQYTKSKKSRKCTCPNCINTSIKKSHTVPRKMSLEVIGEDGGVLMPTFDAVYPVKECCIKMEKIGIGLASTFPGFCKKHEMIFQGFEKEGAIENEGDIIRQAYRNVAYNCFLWKTKIDEWKNTISKYDEIRACATYEYVKKCDKNSIIKKINVSGDDKYIIVIKNNIKNQSEYLGRIEKFKEKMWEEICGKETDLWFYARIIDVVFPACVCGCMEIFFQEKNYVCSIDVIPNDYQTTVSIGFETKIPIELVNAIEYRLSSPITILNFIESIMLHGTDHWYIKPSVWNKLDGYRKKELLLAIQSSDKSIFDESEYSLFDDIRKKIVEIMDLEEELYKHELGKIRH